MKQILAALAMSVIFAACGGGGSGSSGGGIITPPTTKPTTYSVKISFSGGASLRSTAQAIMHPLERTYQAHPLDTGTGSVQLPVELSVLPPSNDVLSNSGTFGAAIVQVQPQPAQSPQVAVSVSGVNVLTSPEPTPSDAPTAAPQFNVETNTTSTGAGTMTATVAAPVGLTNTIPVYVISRAAIVCGPNTVPGSGNTSAPYDNWGGIKFAGGIAQQATSIADADLYLEGSPCTTDGFSSSDPLTIVAPHGMAFISSTASPFATLTTAQCTGAVTSELMSDFVTNLTNPTTPQDEICVNTQDGHVTKLAIYEVGANFGDTSLIFNYEQEGSALDGF